MTKINLNNLNKNDKPKRGKNELSYSIKKDICKTYKDKKLINPKFTQTQLIDMFEPILGYKVKRSTISDIINNQDQIMTSDAEFRARAAKYPELEDCLSIYIKQLLDKGISCSDSIIKNKAKDYGENFFHITNYSYSDGWLANFKQRYSLSKQEKHGESGSVDFNTIKVGRNQIKNITKEFKLSDIYNMDETAFIINYSLVTR